MGSRRRESGQGWLREGGEGQLDALNTEPVRVSSRLDGEDERWREARVILRVLAQETGKKNKMECRSLAGKMGKRAGSNSLAG